VNNQVVKLIIGLLFILPSSSYDQVIDSTKQKESSKQLSKEEKK
jgi:hypothetical protein